MSACNEQVDFPEVGEAQVADNAMMDTPIEYASITTVHESIEVKWKIDPTRSVPTPHPNENEKPRKNVSLKSIHGEIHADITLVNDTYKTGQAPSLGVERERTVIQISSVHRAITTKIHGGSPSRRSFTLLVDSVHADIHLAIPCTFHGPVIISQIHGIVQCSDELEENLIVFGENKGLQRCFLGSPWSYSASAEWAGDVLLVDNVHGNVSIQYDTDSSPY